MTRGRTASAGPARDWRTGGPGRRGLAALLGEMVASGASDLHLAAGHRPKARVHGALVDVGDGRLLSPAETERLAHEALGETRRARFDDGGELDVIVADDELGRFRVNCFRQRESASLAIRRIPSRIPRLGDLGLPPVLGRLADRPRGLVLVAGPAGAGKSTTLAAMVDQINRERRRHIVTIEDPVEFVHPPRRCLISQREVGRDTRDFASAIKSALRQDPDVILVGEMRDPETVQAALDFAETGHLVLATLHTGSAAESVNRIIDSFASDRQAQVRSQLSLVLEGVSVQVLVRGMGSAGRAVATEVMVSTPAVRAVIRDHRVHQLPSLIQAGRKHGMRTMNDALAELYLNGRVPLGEALRHSSDPEALRRAVGEVPPPDAGPAAV